MLVGEIINIIESVAPLRQQEGWDNSGLQIGNREAKVNRVLLCTDVTETVVTEAIETHCEMIVSHHPLLFHGLKTIQDLTPQQRITVEAIKHDIAIYSSHTAMDCYLHGVSGRMAMKLGVRDYKILAPTIDENTGLGIIGKLPEAVSLIEFLQLVKDTFKAPVVRYTTNDKTDSIQTIALCGGAGSEFLQQAIDAGADAYLSADFKYHEFQQADNQIAVVDIGHFESEQFTKEVFAELLQGKVETMFAKADKSPVLIY